MARSRREEALRVAEELLADIEYQRISPTDAARRTSRLARLLDDTDALDWLRYEISGYPTTALDESAASAAERSNRRAVDADDGSHRWWTTHLASLMGNVETGKSELAAGDGSTSSAQSAVIVEREKVARRNAIQQAVARDQGLIEKIVGSFYDYAAARFQELRFGAAVESAFEVVRDEVDRALGDLVPDALPKLSAAFENTTSTNPEDWASAAGTCRRLLKAAADALRPPGPDVGGRKMDDAHYVNRLVDWIVSQGTSETAKAMITADLEHLGRRLDAALEGGHKGAHAEIDRFDASRLVTGTYLLLGDILRLHQGQPAHEA